MHALRARCGILSVAMLAMLPGSGRGATIIDFQTPPVAESGFQVIDPYVAAGVTFTSPAGTVGLVRECALSECSTCPNQWLGTAASPDCPIGTHDGTLRADFPAGEIVTSVSAEFRTVEGVVVVLELYDATDALLGRAWTIASGSCARGSLGATGSVQVDAEAPAAYGLAFVTGFQCGPGTGCFVSCAGFAIDNFAFGSGPTPVRRKAWGRIKTVYRKSRTR